MIIKYLFHLNFLTSEFIYITKYETYLGFSVFIYYTTFK